MKRVAAAWAMGLAVWLLAGCGGDDSSRPFLRVEHQEWLAALPEVVARPFPFCRTDESGLEKWGYIDQSGNGLIQPEFSSATEFTDGRAWVGTEEGRLGR